MLTKTSYLTVALLLAARIVFSQLTLEHTYPDVNTVRENIGEEGVKYYYYDVLNKTLIINNEDHSFWESIQTNLPSGLVFWSTKNLSRHLFDTDDDLEFEIYYIDGNFNTFAKVVDSDGSTLWDGECIVWNGHYKVKSAGKIFSLPDGTLEHDYTNLMNNPLFDSWVEHFEGAGDKLRIQNNNGLVQFYNEDHTLWKSFPMPTTGFAQYSDLFFDNDPDVEVDYLNTAEQLYQVFDANDEPLWETPYSSQYTSPRKVYTSESGLASNKLVFEEDDNGLACRIFNVPDYALEYSFSNNVFFKKLEDEGFRYIDRGGMGVTVVRVYDPVTFEVVHSAEVSGGLQKCFVTDVSVHDIVADDQLEVVARFSAGGNNYDIKVFNATGQILLHEPQAIYGIVQRLENADPKLVTLYSGGIDQPVSQQFKKVYGGLTTTAVRTPALSENLVKVSPNPVADMLTVDLSLMPQVFQNQQDSWQIRVTDMNGRGVYFRKMSNTAQVQIPVADWASGVYIVEVSAAGKTFAQKVVR